MFHFHLFLFSQDGGRYACTCPQNRMKQAGDVKTNPGPSCSVCVRAIMTKHTPMPCVVCAAIAHGSCSVLSRVQRERGQEYRCRDCGGVDGAEMCGVCHRALPTNSRRLSCVECHGVAHGSCSGLSREPLRRGVPYICVRCGGVPPEALREAEATGSQRCGVCEVTLRRGVAFATCGGYHQATHKKCARRRRGEEEWLCSSCEQRDPGLPPQQERDQPQQERDQPADPQRTSTANEKCPTCRKKLRKTQNPLFCKTCGNQFHIKCAFRPETLWRGNGGLARGNADGVGRRNRRMPRGEELVEPTTSGSCQN